MLAEVPLSFQEEANFFSAETASREQLEEQEGGGGGRGLNILMHRVHLSWDINRPLLA